MARVQESYGAAMVSPANGNNNINIIHRAQHDNCGSITLLLKLWSGNWKSLQAQARI